MCIDVLSVHKPLFNDEASLLHWQVFSQYHYRDSCSGKEVGICHEHRRGQLELCFLIEPSVVWCRVALGATSRP